jgi:hypothetical protein
MMTTTPFLSIEAAASLAALLSLVAAFLVIALHSVSADVDPREDGVSAYALTRFGGLYRAQVVVTGGAALLLAFALVAGGFESDGGAIALVLFALSRILIARYPTDPRGTTRISRAGRVHIILAASTFVAIAVAAPWISGTLTVKRDWQGPASAVVALGWATTILALGTFAASSLPVARRFFGLVERGAYAAWLLWILVIGLSVSGST